MKKIILLLVIFIQLLTVGIISKDIYKKKILGAISINPIGKNTVISSASGELKYFYEPKPNTIIKPEPIFAGLENVSYSINADTLNQVDTYSIPKNKDTYRIITIGDSFTFGENVSTNDNYSSQLQIVLNQNLICSGIKKIEVINLGVSGYDIEYTVERFKLRGIKYNPDLVIWLLIEDDFTRLNELLLPKLDKYINETKESGKEINRNQIKMYRIEYNRAKNDISNELGGRDKILSLQKNYIQHINDFYSEKLLFTTFNTTPDVYKVFLEDFIKTKKTLSFMTIYLIFIIWIKLFYLMGIRA